MDWREAVKALPSPAMGPTAVIARSKAKSGEREAALPRARNRGASLETALAKDVVDVILHRRLRDDELSGDLAIPVASSDERRNFPLARRESREQRRALRPRESQRRIAAVEAELVAASGAGELHDRIPGDSTPGLTPELLSGATERRE